MKYTVKNYYGIKGETTHKTAEGALRARDKKRTGYWTVIDTNGNEWDRDFEGKARISNYAEIRD